MKKAIMLVAGYLRTYNIVRFLECRRQYFGTQMCAIKPAHTDMHDENSIASEVPHISFLIKRAARMKLVRTTTGWVP
jgi:hypothetical protein